MLVRDTLAQLLRADAVLLGQLPLQLHEQPHCGVPGEYSREMQVTCLDVEIHPVITPFGARRLIDVKRRSDGHASSRPKVNPRSTLGSSAVKLVGNVARIPLFKSVGCVDVSVPQGLRGLAMPAPVNPRQSGYRHFALRRLERPLGVVIRQAGSSLISGHGNSAQSLGHVAARLRSTRFHHFSPCLAHPQHGRAGAFRHLDKQER